MLVAMAAACAVTLTRAVVLVAASWRPLHIYRLEQLLPLIQNHKWSMALHAWQAAGESTYAPTNP